MTPLSLAEAQQRAVARAAAPAAADLRARAAREKAVAAAQRPDPVLSLSLVNLPADGPDRFSTTRDFMTMRSVSLMQTFTREDKRQARADRYLREADAEQAEQTLRANDVRREVSLAWFQRRAAEQRLALLQAQRSEALLQVDAAAAAQRAGRGSSADVLVARDAVVQIDQALLAAEAAVATARRNLARWTDEPVERPLADAPTMDRHGLVDRPLAAQLAQHPGLAQLAAREAVAVSAAAVARAEREPDWSAELMFSQRGSRYSNMVSIGVSVPLPWDRPQRQDRELAASLAQADALRAERVELERQVLAMVEGWIDGWRAALARLALIDREREPLAQQRVEAVLAAYRGGTVPLGAVLDARRSALALRMERIDIELDAARVWAALDTLIPAAGDAR
ncbi:TolC family protein [Rubrivivax albus]|uniref:TolC family protein n=1 Tax=Rubrivivax albus TaxID=2499835 RepID=UPI001305203C|nr:TolC family protein [Rubrivivax albus]